MLETPFLDEVFSGLKDAAFRLKLFRRFSLNPDIVTLISFYHFERMKPLLLLVNKTEYFGPVVPQIPRSSKP